MARKAVQTMLNYEQAWEWLEKHNGGLYGSTQSTEGAWQCTVGGVRRMHDVRCTGNGARHAEALERAVHTLRGVYNLLPMRRDRNVS